MGTGHMLHELPTKVGATMAKRCLRNTTLPPRLFLHGLAAMPAI